MSNLMKHIVFCVVLAIVIVAMNAVITAIIPTSDISVLDLLTGAVGMYVCLAASGLIKIEML